MCFHCITLVTCGTLNHTLILIVRSALLHKMTHLFLHVEPFCWDHSFHVLVKRPFGNLVEFPSVYMVCWWLFGMHKRQKTSVEQNVISLCQVKNIKGVWSFFMRWTRHKRSSLHQISTKITSPSSKNFYSAWHKVFTIENQDAHVPPIHFMP